MKGCRLTSSKDLGVALGVLQGLMSKGKKSKGEQALFSYDKPVKG